MALNKLNVEITKTYVGISGRSVDAGQGNSPNSEDTGGEVEIVIPTPPVLAGQAAETAGSVNLTWNEDENVVSYIVTYSETAGNNTPSEDGLPISGANVGKTEAVTITGLSYGTTYYFRIRAINTAGTSDYSNEVSVVTGVSIVSAPVITGETGEESSSVLISWSSVFGATSYNVYYTNVGSPRYIPSLNGDPGSGDSVGNSTSVLVTNLEPSEDYYFVITSVNSAGESSYSNEVLVTSQVLNPVAPELPPQDVEGEPGNRGEIILSWVKPSNTTSYIIYYDEDPHNPPYIPTNNGTPANGTNVGNVSTVTITGLPDNTIYRLAVRGVNAFGMSVYSQEIVAQTSLGIPIAPQNFLANSGDDDGKAILTWTASQDASSYIIYYDENSSTEPFTPADDGVPASGTNVGNVTSVEITGLTPGQLYFFAAKAVNSAGTSALSTADTATASITPPYAPNGFTAEEDDVEGTIRLSWDTVGNALGYKIYYGESSGTVPYTPIQNGTPANGSDVGNVTSVLIYGLTASDTYYLRVRGYNNGGDGALTDEINAIARPRILEPINVIAVPGTNDGEVQLSWDASIYATSYKIYFDDATGPPYSGVPGSEPASGSNVGNVTTTTIAGLIPFSQTYYFSVIAVDGLSSIETDYSEQASSIAKLNPPDVPVVTLQQGNSGEIIVSWTASDTADGYRVYYDINTTLPHTPPVEHTGNQASGVDVFNVVTFTLTGLTPGQQYYVYLIAYNNGGDSNYSAAKNISAGTASASPVTATAEVNVESWYSTIESADGTPTSTELPNRYNWMVPFPVFVEGWKSSSTAGDIVSWTWNWGDGSVNGNGMNNGHIYEVAGEYTITLTAQDEFGNTNTDTIIITAQARTGTTYYVNTAGNDSNNGLSTGTAWRSATKALTEISNNSFSPGDRILFERGGEYALETGNCIIDRNSNVLARYGFYIGAYGSEIAAKPIFNMTYPGPDSTYIWAILSGWRGFAWFGFMDVDFQGIGNNTGIMSVFRDCSHIFMLRCNFDNVYQALTIQSTIEDENYNTFGRSCQNIFFIENTGGSGATAYDDTNFNAGLFASSQITLFLYCIRACVLGNTIRYSNNHINYNSFVKYGIWENNTFSFPAYGRTAFRLSGTSGSFDLPSERVHVINNIFSGCFDNRTEDGDAHANRWTYSVVDLYPNVSENQSIENCRFEDNEVHDGNRLIRIGNCENLIIKNNLFTTDDNQNGMYGPRFEMTGESLIKRPCVNVRFVNNIIDTLELNRGGQGNPLFYISHYNQAAAAGYSDHQDIYITDNTITCDGRVKLYQYGPIAAAAHSTQAEYLAEIKCVWSDNNTLTVPTGTNNQFIRCAGGYQSGGFNLTLAAWQTFTADVVAHGNLPSGARDLSSTINFV